MSAFPRIIIPEKGKQEVMHSTKKGATPIEVAPEWSQGLLIFPGSI
nr:MAG TPA_asm: hypothetical protein [Caudoviricetes sp.]